MRELLTHGLEWTYRYLKEHGIRVTPQRQAVLQYLDQTDSHPTAEMIHDWLASRLKGVSLATVYNILHLYRDMGIVMELSYGDTSARWDGNFQNHYHITCTTCGRVDDYRRDLIPKIEEEAERATGFRVTHHRVELSGVCPDCQARGDYAAQG